MPYGLKNNKAQLEKEIKSIGHIELTRRLGFEAKRGPDL
jgi:hypothetical protein